ncbi:MAG TPA: hypothetical protein VFC07_16365 [Verrucomicrobiae bacterium]|nr:hypothetical protein [Verrucomicrobiae bacterium]
MTRNGKIARLPHAVRTELNERLRDGEGGQALLDWLNGLEETKKVVAEKFKGVPVHANNLSEWREGGFVDWLKQQETLDLAEQIAERAADLVERTDGSISEFHENLSAVLALELAGVAKALLEGAADPVERWKQLRGIIKQATALRRSDQRAAQMRIREEEWAYKSAEILKRKRINDGIEQFSHLYMTMEKAKLNRERQALEERKTELRGRKAAWQAEKEAREGSPRPKVQGPKSAVEEGERVDGDEFGDGSRDGEDGENETGEKQG